MAQVANPRYGRLLAEHGRPLPGRGDHRAVVGDRQPRAHARLLIDVLDSPRSPADFFDQLLHEVGNDDFQGGRGSVEGGVSESEPSSSPSPFRLPPSPLVSTSCSTI